MKTDRRLMPASEDVQAHRDRAERWKKAEMFHHTNGETWFLILY